MSRLEQDAAYLARVKRRAVHAACPAVAIQPHRMQPFGLVTDPRTSPARVRASAHPSRYAARVTDWTGAEIERRRINHGLSRRQLAAAVGVAYSTVHRWEQTDRPEFDTKTRDRLNQALPDVDTADGWSGQEIKRRRQLLKLTQGDLAEAAGVSRRSILDWEKGAAVPGGENLMHLQEVLRLPGEGPSPLEGIPLADAGFAEVVTRLVEIHNEQRRALGQPPLLEFGDIAMPADLPEHDKGDSSDAATAERVDFDPTHQDDAHPR